MAHANLLDAILNEPRPGSTKTASADLADTFLDTGGTVQHARNSAARVASSEDSLAEAAIKIASTPKAQSLTIEAAISLVEATTGQQALKTASATAQTALRASYARLKRLAAKTASQMKQDGATKLADYADVTVVPTWAKTVRADLKLIASHLGQSTKTASTEELLAERALTDKEVTGYIHKLLNEGVTPNEVEQKLKKLAELQGFNRQFATDKLRNDAGLLGYSFLEPNHFMESCPSTYEQMQQKLGGVRAASVKQIAACTGCQHFSKNAGAKRCNLYRLPIVANQPELLPIINNLTPGIKGASAKKAALVAQHNRQAERPVVGTKEPSKQSPYVRNTETTAVLDRSPRKLARKEASFTPADALRMHEAGQNLTAIYKHASATVGAAQAKAALRKFVAGLKGTNTKIALTQIDCTQLQNKLATSNGIVGEKKCASCTYRRGMHCGFTGGTLLAFPGMENTKTNHRIASGAPKDGHGMLVEFEMTKTARQADIKYSGGLADVELNEASKVEL